MSEEAILLEYHGKVAIITLNQLKKLNALKLDMYYRLATCMREVAARDDIYITVLTGKEAIGGLQPTNEDIRRYWLKNFVMNNLHITHAFYTHPKIFISFIPAPHSYLLTPFSSLGLVAEGNASVGFVRWVGISKANETLIMSKRITCEVLVHVGFVNKVINVGSKDSPKFPEEVLEEVLKEFDDWLGSHLNSDSLIKIKALIRKPEMEILKGIPQEEFRKIASGEKKHKL
ncbi:ClpP/crotonase [Zopfia rhizophila CBS 207.26]|uniref:ClpP/crotonase n=1 Tax=Zopfia rhizophila CBS 207.26 TaxID=1314779 RepID=A0A6A6DML7_9PEZI|nr:ClpP/crotonase [Zopfia rhizophila CBS 207.26]